MIYSGTGYSAKLDLINSPLKPLTFFAPRIVAAVLRRSTPLALLALTLVTPSPAQARQRFPNILLITIDTLRADRLSTYGYDRQTSPELDALLANGTLFTQARTIEPLTGPASCSMITSIYPHEHGASRNSLAMRPGLASLPKRLAQRGYATAAFIGNWTLRDKLTGLGEHFQSYQELFTRRRWFGLFNAEATAADVTEAALSWTTKHHRAEPHRPFFVWIHYVEPHAPYRLQKPFASRLGIKLGDGVERSDRYDTEIAFVDDQIGVLLRGIADHSAPQDTLIIFTSDHGESLGEHGYWGHGRHLWEPSLRIPFGIVWPGKVPPGRRIDAPALILDVAPTVLGLIGLPVAESFRGYDWSPVLSGESQPPDERLSLLQAHKGAVVGDNANNKAREGGLLEVAIIEGQRKELLDLRAKSAKGPKRKIYDFVQDPRELRNLTDSTTPPSTRLESWLAVVRQGLKLSNDLPAAELDEEALEKLKALGYID